nr:hypothetical protein [Micromonospora purpureochromogenes]
MTTTTNQGGRIEGLVLVLILIAVAGFAGAASFTHVKDWTLANSPTGTGAWFGWANAVISELVPIACLLTIRRRRRTGAPIGYPAEPIRVQVAEQVTTEPVPPAAITPTPAAEPEPATAPTHAPAAGPEPVSAPAEPVDVPVPSHLLPMARFAAVQHEQATGQPITPAELADRLDVTPPVAGQLLASIGGGAR